MTGVRESLFEDRDHAVNIYFAMSADQISVRGARAGEKTGAGDFAR